MRKWIGAVKMKIWKKVVLTIIITLVVAVLGVGIWQYENIMVLVKTATTSSENIAKEIDNSKKIFDEKVRQQYPSIISDLTAEEEKKLMKGELSVEEAVSILTQKYKEKPKQVVANASRAEIDKLVGEKAIELYSLKAYYLGQLGQLEATVKSDYLSLPKEKKNLIGKQELVTKYMGTALGLLNQCDARVEEMLAELKTDIEKLNGDTSIIETIREAYKNEKNLKKAYYIKLLEE